MNRRMLLSAGVFFLLLHPASVWAGRPIVDVEGSPIPAGLSDKQIQTAMKSGGETRGWIVKTVADGQMEATLFVRSHMAKVDIYYGNGEYAIRYKDSENLGYKNGKIHRNYNKWVQNLNMDIQRAFAML